MINQSMGLNGSTMFKLTNITKRIAKNFLFIAVLLVTVSIIVMSFALSALAEVSNTSSNQAGGGEWQGVALLGAGIAVAGSCIGAGVGIAGAASSGLAAMVEKPEMAIWVLILAGLAEGVAIYGLLVSIMIIGKIP